ncbi:MAG TPA: hypothetical protein VFD30_15640 [Terriglobia bacterium]|nr:hypothetical protein [Terriglobia bacterium]
MSRCALAARFVRTGCALVFALPLAAFGQTDLNPTVPEAVGLNIHFTHAQPGEMKMLAESGVRWIRMDFDWSSTEKARGRYDFSSYDRLMDELAPHKIRPIFILDYSNPLYDGGLSPHTDEGRQAFAQWVVASVLHFKGRGILWEMYNEPNFFWRPKPNVEDYAKLVLVVGEALLNSAPDESFIGPATSGIDLVFLEQCFRAGLLNYWSAVSVHPYRQMDPETAAEGYRNVRELILRYAPPGKQIPIISGEWGYSSTWNWPGSGEENQARLLAREFLSNIANEVPLSIWYDWHDDGPDPRNPEFHSGIVRFPYLAGKEQVFEPKPAYHALRALTSFLRDDRFSKRLAVGGPDDYVLLFHKGDEVRLAAWTASSIAHEVVIPASPGLFSVRSINGEELPSVIARRNGLRLTLSNAPQYLVPVKSNAFLTLAAAWERLPLEIRTRGPKELEISTALRNPLRKPIQLKSGPKRPGLLAPKSETSVVKVARIFRVFDPQPVRMELEIRGMGRIAQETKVFATNPLRARLLPIAGDQLPLLVENPSGEEFHGRLELTELKGLRCPNLAAPLELRKGELVKVVGVRIDTGSEHSYRARVRILDARNESVTIGDLSNLVLLSGFAERSIGSEPAALVVMPDGDPKVQSEQTIQIADPPEGPPLPGLQSIRVSYHFEPGRKLARVTPKKSAMQDISGAPAWLGLWIYGDGTGNYTGLSFADSTGQVFQEPGRPLSWRGWRFAWFPMDRAHATFRGGAFDGVIHFPIRWDSVLFIDSAEQKATSGTVYLSAPALYY